MMAVFAIVHAAELDLKPGWNWISFTTLPTSHKVGDVLGTTGFTANDIILSNEGMSRFTGSAWLPANFSVDYRRMYKIYVANATTVEISGNANELYYVSLDAGWNWIGNSIEKSVTPAELTHGGVWTRGDRIHSSGGVVTYTGSKWIPSTGFLLEPGIGYQIYKAQAGALVFPADEEDEALYAVVDLSAGPDAIYYPVRYTNTAPNLDDDTCRTTELWLRKIPVGTFTMGSTTNVTFSSGSGHYHYYYNYNETQHQVTLTQDYYIGVFECTQKQWQLVMGSNPSYYKGDCRPVETVSYQMIRGSSSTGGAGWPTYGHEVDFTSFMGKLQGKTGLVFDLPTEAQWEYACRAGTTTSLNSGRNATTSSDNVQDAAMDEIGRYSKNTNDGRGGYSYHTKVGSYIRNAWGLYDMHGNVSEWCLDWNYNTYSSNQSNGESYSRSYYDYNTGSSSVSNPKGPTSGSYRIVRGGGYNTSPTYCRSSCRYDNSSTPSSLIPSFTSSTLGFRVAYLP